MRRDWVCWLTIAGGALAGAIDAVNPHERSPRWLNVAMCAAYFALLLGTLPASMRMLIREYRKARQPIPAAAPYMPPDDDALSQPRWRVVARPLPARARQRFLAELPVCLEEEGLADRNGWRVLLAGLLCASVAVFISADPGEGWPFRLLFLSLGLIGAVFFALVFHPHTVLSPNGVEWGLFLHRRFAAWSDVEWLGSHGDMWVFQLRRGSKISPTMWEPSPLTRQAFLAWWSRYGSSTHPDQPSRERGPLSTNERLLMALLILLIVGTTVFAVWSGHGY